MSGFKAIETRVVHEVLTRELERLRVRRFPILKTKDGRELSSRRAFELDMKIAALESAIEKLAGEQQPLQFGDASRLP